MNGELLAWRLASAPVRWRVSHTFEWHGIVMHESAVMGVMGGPQTWSSFRCF